MVLGLKPMGKPSTKNIYYYECWTEPRPCMVLGLKHMGKPSTKIFIITSFGQNQGLVWSSDLSLWGNQVQNFYYYKFWTESRPFMILGLKPMGKPSTKFFYYYKLWTEPRRCTFLGPKPTGKPTARMRKGLNFARWAT